MVTTQFSGLEDLAQKLIEWADIKVEKQVFINALNHWLEQKVDELTEDIEDSFDRDYQGLRSMVAEYEYRATGDCSYYP